MKREVSFLGLAFEGAFKLGFLKELLPDYEDFKQKQVFEKLKGELESFENGIAYMSTLELLERNIPFDPFGEIPQELTNLGVENNEQKTLLFLFLLGYYQGIFYRKKFKEVELIKYHMGEESQQAGIYKNADLLFVAQEDGSKSLQVLDFKLAGARKKLSELFGKKEGRIPYRVFGLPVNLSLGELSFDKFIHNIIRVEDKLLSLKEASAELKGFLQVLSYAVDYLSEHKRHDLREVSLALIYPLSEPFVARFWLRDKDISVYRDKVRELYEKVREKSWEFEEVDATRLARIKRLKESASQQIEELTKEISRRQENVHTITPDPISESRKDVGERLKWFLALTEKVKVLCLLHSAGSGKTSQTRELILNSEGKHIVFYFATRRVLITREYDLIEKKAKDYNIALVREEKSAQKSNYVKASGDVYESSERQSGIMKRTVEEIKKLTTKEYRFIWAFATQQAIVSTRFAEKSTAKYIQQSLTSERILREYTFHFILDEFLGHPNGLFAIEELLEVLKTIKNRGGKANLYIFDANGYTPALLRKLMEEYREFEVFPNALVLSDFKQEEHFEIDGIPFYSFAKHGYPSPEIKLKKYFVFLEKSVYTKDGEEEFLNKLANIFQETFTDKEESTAFTFIQYKEHLSKLMDRLEERGYKTLVATADSRKSQKRINEGNEDVILATSAISRGIDLSRPHKPVNHIYAVIYDWGVEGNLVELIQAISRARGDERTESIPKTLNLIYVIEPTSEYIVEKIEEYLEEEKADTETIKLLYQKHTLEQKLILDDVITRVIEQFLKGRESTALVPVPTQYKTKYIPNRLSDLEALLGFLEGIRYIEDAKGDIYTLQETILSALSASVVNFNLQSYIDYFHPYILSEEKLRYSFDNEKRGKVRYLLEKVKPILKDHNEERLRELEEIVHSFLPGQEDQVPVLIPTYAIVLIKHFLTPKGRIEFTVNSRIGRGGADVLMGTVEPKTKCYVSDRGENEYACITLTEDYPYKEVLSGRFVKFPVEFIKGLLEA